MIAKAVKNVKRFFGDSLRRVLIAPPLLKRRPQNAAPKAPPPYTSFPISLLSRSMMRFSRREI